MGARLARCVAWRDASLGLVQSGASARRSFFFAVPRGRLARQRIVLDGAAALGVGLVIRFVVRRLVFHILAFTPRLARLVAGEFLFELAVVFVRAQFDRLFRPLFRLCKISRLGERRGKRAEDVGCLMIGDLARWFG